jgi:hypothetical protein
MKMPMSRGSRDEEPQSPVNLDHFKTIIAKKTDKHKWGNRDYALLVNEETRGHVAEDEVHYGSQSVNPSLQRVNFIGEEEIHFALSGYDSRTGRQMFRFEIINSLIKPQPLFDGFHVRSYRSDRGIFDGQNRLVACRIFTWQDSEVKQKIAFKIHVRQDLEEHIQEKCVLALGCII